jgi:glutaredoxin|tara:strand:- start:310 stop:594 length:285 start_codon:yes stop_codon:yes gene_type:complete
MKVVVVYSMDGCPHCTSLKSMLKEEKVSFQERNIKDYEEEYSQFVKVMSNEYLPAITLIEMNEEDKPNIQLLAPDTSFKDLHEAVNKIKDFLLE